MTPPVTVIIRAAVRADVGRLSELSAVLGYPASAEAVAARLERLAASADDLVLVAELPGGPVIGWLHASEQELLETGRRVEIVGLVVDAARPQQCGQDRVPPVLRAARLCQGQDAACVPQDGEKPQ